MLAPTPVTIPSRLARIAALALLLAGCSQPKPEEARPEASIPVVAPPPRPTPHPVVHANWAFETRSDECVAVAAGGGTTLRIAIRRGSPIAVSVSVAANQPLPHGAIPLRFAGPAGNWQVTAVQSSSRQITAPLGAGDTALSRVLVLLSGGALDVGSPDKSPISIIIPPSSSQGQLWFDCARRQMF